MRNAAAALINEAHKWYGQQPTDVQVNFNKSKSFMVEKDVFVRMIKSPVRNVPYTNVNSDVPRYVMKDLQAKKMISKEKNDWVNIWLLLEGGI